VNQADTRGNTPLHYAALSDYGETTVVKLSLAAGAKREIQNRDGVTPADAARKFAYVQIASLLD